MAPSGVGGAVTVNLKRLRANPTDASVWADEFCRSFRGQRVEVGAHREAVDSGTMIGWFANAMGSASDDATRPLSKAMQAAFTELGIPGPGYPAPAANAWEILHKVLHEDPCPEAACQPRPIRQTWLGTCDADSTPHSWSDCGDSAPGRDEEIPSSWKLVPE